MTVSKVLFDTSAWWEVLRGSAEGARLKRHYLDRSRVHVLTSVISLGELSAKLSAQGLEGSIPLIMGSLRQASTVEDLTSDLAVKGGLLRTHLRKRVKSASLADGIVLATAREHGARIISSDAAFAQEPDPQAG